MKKASLVLGLVGGVLAIVFAVIFMVGGMLMGQVTDAFVSEAEARGMEVTESDSASVDAATGTMWLIGIASVAGAALGIVGGILAKKKSIIAGILLIAAAIPSFFTGLGIIASILFIIGGVLAFIPQKSPQDLSQRA